MSKVKSTDQYKPMDSAPRDGTIIRLGPSGVLARHVTTRRFVGGRWHKRSKWVDPIGGQTHKFEPTGWLPHSVAEEIRHDSEQLQQHNRRQQGDERVDSDAADLES